MQVEDQQAITATDAVEAQPIEINIDFRRLLTRNVVLMLALLLLGGMIRYYTINAAGFPIRDGALPYRAARTVLDNGFRYPTVIPYNGGDFPFLYPPLGIFTAAAASQQFDIPLLDMFRYLPAFASALTVPVVYLLTRTLFGAKTLSFVAALVYALMPSNVILSITGGDVATTPGLLFALLAIQQAYLLIVKRSENHLLPAALLATLAFLFDLAMGAFAMNTALLLLVLHGRNRYSLLNWLLLVISTVILVGLWFFPIVIIHTGRIYGAMLSLATGGLSMETVVQLAISNVGGEVLIPIMTILGMLGFFVFVARRRFLLPLWYLTTIVFLPTNAPLLVTVPLSIMVAVALVQLLFPLLADASYKTYEDGIPALRFARQEFVRNANKQIYHLPVYATAVVLLVYAIHSVYVSANPLRDPQIPDAELEAMAWINTNLPEDARFLVITDDDNWETDTALDWFPVLANRESVINVRASLWDGTYRQQIGYYERLTDCKGSNIECLFALEEQIAIDAGATQEETSELTSADLVRLRSGAIQQATQPRLRVFDFVYVSVRERGALSGFIALDSQTETSYRSIRSEGGVLILQPVEDEPLDTSQFTQ